MSYLVLARKYRPRTFAELVGQEHVVKTLSNAIAEGRLAHAFLFVGPRGIGKTSTARILAKALNCSKGPRIDFDPDEDICKEIAEGRSLDVLEIDGASNRGINEIKDLRESVPYAPARGKFKIYIIDEVHMLSTAAFNALLKTLEEPPPRSLFIFATTNPEKIPFTVLSRCQRHDLRRIALSTVSERLAEICRSEGITISGKALSAIAREGEGSMRDAQTLLDQIVAYGGQRIADEVVAEILDLVDRNVLKAIVEACIEGDARAALEQLGAVMAGGSEAGRIAEALLELLRDLTVLQIAPDAEGLFEGTDEEREALRQLGARCEPARLRRMFRALVREIEDLGFAPKPSAVLEMAVIRLATMPAGDDVEKLLGRLDQLERRLAGAERAGGSGTAMGSAASTASTSSSASPSAPRELPRGVRALPTREATREGARDATRGKPGPQPVPTRSQRGPQDKPPAREEPDEPDGFDGPPAPAAAPFALAPDALGSKSGNPNGAAGGPAPDPTSDEGLDEAGLESFEDASLEADAASAIGFAARPGALFERLRAKAFEVDRARHASLEQAECVSATGNRLRLAVSTSFHAERVRARIGELEALAQGLFGRAMKIEVELQAVKTPAQDSAESRERSRRRRQEALNSEPVNLAIEILDAEIVEIRPLGENR